MSEKAPMPPWWVSPFKFAKDGTEYSVMGGTRDQPVVIFSLWDTDFENAKELADLIVQRTKHEGLREALVRIEIITASGRTDELLGKMKTINSLAHSALSNSISQGEK